jgi:hypothetical protein
VQNNGVSVYLPCTLVRRFWRFCGLSRNVECASYAESTAGLGSNPTLSATSFILFTGQGTHPTHSPEDVRGCVGGRNGWREACHCGFVGGETSAQVATAVSSFKKRQSISTSYREELAKYWTALEVTHKVRTRLVSKPR